MASYGRVLITIFSREGRRCEQDTQKHGRQESRHGLLLFSATAGEAGIEPGKDRPCDPAHQHHRGLGDLSDGLGDLPEEQVGEELSVRRTEDDQVVVPALGDDRAPQKLARRPVYLPK